MIFDFFKILFSKNEERDPIPIESIIETHEPNIPQMSIKKSTEPQIKKEIPLETINKELKSTQHIPKKNDIIKQTKESNMNINDNIFLVVIDTNGRNEAVNFQKGIQNFYFVLANNEDEAKTYVLSTFRNNPAVLGQLQYATKATRLKSIVGGMGPGQNFWTYVPMGGQRSPGQQAILPTPESLLRKDEYGNMSSKAYAPRPPISGEEVTPEDLKNVQFSPEDSRVLSHLKNKSENTQPASNDSSAAVLAMLQKMQADIDALKGANPSDNK